eukprot:3650156-Rhodomonas_salina.1
MWGRINRPAGHTHARRAGIAGPGSTLRGVGVVPRVGARLVWRGRTRGTQGRTRAPRVGLALRGTSEPVVLGAWLGAARVA